jgi:hypothetical protein
MEWSCGLPLAAWTVIILLLEVREDGKVLGKMRLVCKAWTIHCDQNIVKLFLSSAGPITVMARMRFLRKFPQLQEVLISEENYTWGKALDSLPKSLTCLTLDTNVRRSDSCDLAGFTALTTLDLWGRFEHLLGLEGLSSLKSLSLSGTMCVLGDGAFRSLSGLTNLTYLDLTNCHKLSPTHGFATLACFTGLTSLNLAGTMANNTVLLETVSTLSALAHLEIDNDELVRRVMITTTAVRELKNILPGIRVWKQRFSVTKYLGFRSELMLVY